MKTVEIRYRNGNMKINCEYFFPATARDLTKLLKVISMDDANAVINKATILEYLKNEEIPRLKSLAETNAKKYFIDKQCAADLKQKIDSKRYANGLPISQDDLKDLKQQLRNCRDRIKRDGRNYNGCISRISKINKNIEQIERG